MLPDLAELALDRNASHPLERVESTHCLLPLESTLGRESGNSGIGITPDATLTENQEGAVILLAIRASSR